MKIKDKHYQTIWYEQNSSLVKIIDQTKLPHEFIIKDIHNADEMVNAILTMEVRGAPLIGGAAAFGVALAAKEKKDLNFIKQSYESRMVFNTQQPSMANTQNATIETNSMGSISFIELLNAGGD